MPFPFSYSNSWLIHKNQPSDILQKKIIYRLTEKIEYKPFILVKKQNDTLYFRGDFFRFVWNGLNVLNPISNGKIEIKEINSSFVISYKVYFFEIFILSLLFSIVPLVFVRLNPIIFIIDLLVIWILFFTVTRFITIIRFDNYMKNIIKEFDTNFINY